MERQKIAERKWSPILKSMGEELDAVIRAYVSGTPRAFANAQIAFDNKLSAHLAAVTGGGLNCAARGDQECMALGACADAGRCVRSAVTTTAAEQFAGALAYQLTKVLVIDMPTARAAVDAASLTALSA